MITHFLDSPIVFYILYILVALVIAIGGLLMVRWIYPPESLMRNNEIAGFTFSVVALFYALQLGFTMASVQLRFETINKNIESEANTLSEIQHDASFFLKVLHDKVRDQILKYIHLVITEELHGPDINQNAAQAEKEIWKLYSDYTPQSEKEKIWYSESLAKLNDFNRLRLERQYYSTLRLDYMMWTLLIGGACGTVGFMYFFGVESLKMHIIITATLTILVTFLVLLVSDFDDPFEGAEQITPAAFIAVKEKIAQL